MTVVDRMVLDAWKRSRLYRMLSLGGYVAFDVPRVVTAMGALLLAGIAAAHAYVMVTRGALPLYFSVYATALIATCLLIAIGLWLDANQSVPQRSWLCGDVVCVVFLGGYLVTRIVELPGLLVLTARWDVAPATLAAASAAGFLAVHMSVLLRINVAYPQRQNWQD